MIQIPLPCWRSHWVPVAVEGDGEVKLWKIPERPDWINSLSGGLDSPPEGGWLALQTQWAAVLRVRDSSPAQLSVSQTLNLTVMRNSSPLILNEYNAVSNSSFLNGGDAVQDGDGRSAPAYSQDSFFGRLAGNGGDWFELVVTGDGGPGTVDLRGWRIEIATGAPIPFIPADVVVLSNHTFWAVWRQYLAKSSM